MGGAVTKLRAAFWATFALGLVDLALIDLVLAPRLSDEAPSAPASATTTGSSAVVSRPAPRRPDRRPELEAQHRSTKVAASPATTTERQTTATPTPAAAASATAPTETATKPVAASPPVAPATAPPELPTIHFDTASSRLNSRYRRRLDEVARWLRASHARLRLRGHSDSRGEDDYNDRLSERRAQSVAQFLRRRGVDANQVETEAVGSAEPAVAGNTPEAWAACRRVELVHAR